MLIEKGAIVSKTAERFGSFKNKVSLKSRKEKTGSEKEI